MLTESDANPFPRDREYTFPGGRHKSMENNDKPSASRRRTRLLYFGTASAWGFVCGVVGLAAVLASRGQVIGFNNTTFLLLLPGLAVAVLGGAVASVAYRDARRRGR